MSCDERGLFVPRTTSILPILSSQGGREMLVDNKPVLAALLPNSCVTHFCFRSLTVLGLFGKMHGHGGPSKRPTAADLQVLPCGKSTTFHAGEELLLHAVVVFLPAVIREWSQVIKHQPALLGVELCRSVGVSGAPGRAILIG